MRSHTTKTAGKPGSSSRRASQTPASAEAHASPEEVGARVAAIWDEIRVLMDTLPPDQAGGQMMLGLLDVWEVRSPR
jgi:hypothetical protein